MQGQRPEQCRVCPGWGLNLKGFSNAFVVAAGAPAADVAASDYVSAASLAANFLLQLFLFSLSVIVFGSIFRLPPLVVPERPITHRAFAFGLTQVVVGDPVPPADGVEERGADAVDAAVASAAVGSAVARRHQQPPGSSSDG